MAGLAAAVFAVAAPAGADEWRADALVARGEEAYIDGRVEDALRLWNESAAAGHCNPQLDYARGNACYRLGRLPEAIAFYRRAQRELPRDPDVDWNLRVAARDAGVEIPDPGRLRRWLGGLSAREWMVCAVAAFWLAVALAAAALLLPGPWNRHLRGPLAVAAVLFLGASGAAWGSIRDARAHPERVVAGPAAALLRSAPIESAPPLAELPPGTLLRTLDERPLWIEVSSGTLRGWISAADLLPDDAP